MFCYLCDTEMEKHNRNSVLIDECPNCGGVWLDGNELNKIVKNNKPVNLIKEMTREIVVEHKEIHIRGLCPRCHKNKLHSYFLKQLKLDKCESCDGIFFDKNELDKYIKLKSESWFGKLLSLFV